MCGIIGYVGENQARDKIINGLLVLEYRGYDSVGICVGSELEVVKTKGRVSALEKRLGDWELPHATVGIGHTRWATHGAPSDVNAHPHRVGRVALVHNGIIENYRELKELLESKGYTFKSETDTEVAAGVLDFCIGTSSDTVTGINRGLRMMKGSYAFAIMVSGEGERIYATRCGSPLIVGKGADGFYLASDITALLPFTRTYYSLREGEILTLERQGVHTTGQGICWQETTLTPTAAQKGGYEHFMLKEMWEQPRVIKDCLRPRIVDSLPNFNVDGIGSELFAGVSAIHMVACGSAMHAGLFARKAFEEWAEIPTGVYVASEYRYSPPLADGKTLVIIISQSGETADSLASLRHAKERGLKTLAVVNTVESSIAREADYRAYTYAGPEIAVATTKGYMTQACLLLHMASAAGLARGKISADKAKEITKHLFSKCPEAVEAVLRNDGEIRALAEKIYEKENIFYIGRGVDYALAMEAALKLKEISYIHCEAYPSGELKHGTISLIEEGTPVIAISTEKHLYDKLYSNVKEVSSRGALTALIGGEDGAEITVKKSEGNPVSDAFAAVTAAQLLAYHVAQLRGCDIDKPRNLAKSVTVE